MNARNKTWAIALAGLLPCLGAEIEIPKAAKVILQNGENLAGRKIDTKNYTADQLKEIGNHLTGPGNLQALLSVMKALKEKDHAVGTTPTQPTEEKLIRSKPSESTTSSSGRTMAPETKGLTPLLEAVIRDAISLTHDQRVTDGLGQQPTNGDFLKALKAKDKPIFEMALDHLEMGRPVGMDLFEEGIAILMEDRQTVALVGETHMALTFNSPVDSFAVTKSLLWGLSPTKQGFEMIANRPEVDGLRMISKWALTFTKDYPGNENAARSHDLKFTWFAESENCLKTVGQDKNCDTDGPAKLVPGSGIPKGETFQSLALGTAGNPLVVTDHSIVDIRPKTKNYRHLRGTDLKGTLKVAQGSTRELWVAHEEGLTKFTQAQGGKWSRKLVAAHPDGAVATDMVLGPDGLPWLVYQKTHRLGVFDGDTIQVVDLGEGSAPVQILAGKARLFVRLAGRASILVVDPSLKAGMGTEGDDLEETKEVKTSIRASSRKPKARKETRLDPEEGSSLRSSSSSARSTPDSHSPVTASTDLSLSSSISSTSTSSSSSSSSRDTQVLSSDSGSGEWQWPTCKLKSIGMDHILARHGFGGDGSWGQFDAEASETTIQDLIRQAVHDPDIVGPSYEEGRQIRGRTFSESVGWAYDWETGRSAPTNHLLVVVNPRTGHAVTSYPVHSLPRWF